MRKVLVYLLFIGIVFTSCEQSNKSGMIGDSEAVFYPQNFEAEQLLPSFALLNEPVVTSGVNDDWKIKPEYYLSEDSLNAIKIPVGEAVDLYGTGEVFGDLNRSGKDVTLWNTDNYAYGKDEGKRLYQSHPWILGVRPDGTSFGILVDNTWKQYFKLTNPIEIKTEGPAPRVVVIEKDSPQEVIKKLAELTGTMEMPPLWALGFQQCRYSYFPDTRVKEIADEYRKREIPCDVIWMDIDYMQNYKIFTFDSVAFSNPQSVNDYLHQKDFKSVWMIDPGVKKEEGYHVYDQGKAGDHWVKTADHKDFVGSVWPGPCVFPDYTRPETCEWWGTLYKDFMATGVDGVWNDMNEPSVFDGPDGTMPEDNWHRGGGLLPAGSHLRYHNVYGMMMVNASREGILKVNPDKRPFVLSRSNYLGGQRYAATWTGDNASTWEHMKVATPMILNLGLSGQPFSGPDIGGFKGDGNPELIANWMAVGAFYPFSRNHTENNSINQEPWAFGKTVEDVSRVALERRYRLMPYLYTLFHEASIDGLPVMRPVFFADTKDQDLRNEQEAFLLGKDLLVVPQYANNPSLPNGIWKTIHLLDGDKENDGYQAELKQRGGSVLPLTKVMQSTEEYQTDSLTILVTLDKEGKAKGQLYMDAGNGFGYKNGEYAIDEYSAVLAATNEVIVNINQTEGALKSKARYYKVGLVSDEGIKFSEWENDGLIKIDCKK